LLVYSRVPPASAAAASTGLASPCAIFSTHGPTGAGYRPFGQSALAATAGEKYCWSMIFSENRASPPIRSGAGMFGIML
jgi:hypothetical protein